jgi:hypothetical protein
MLGCLSRSEEAVIVMAMAVVSLSLWECECLRQRMKLVWRRQEHIVSSQQRYYLDLLYASHPTIGRGSGRGPYCVVRTVAGALQAA